MIILFLAERTTWKKTFTIYCQCKSMLHYDAQYTWLCLSLMEVFIYHQQFNKEDCNRLMVDL